MDSGENGENSMTIDPFDEKSLPVEGNQSHIINISEDNRIIKNNTRQRIRLDSGKNSLVIPAFGKKTVPMDFLKGVDDIEQWKAWGLIEELESKSNDESDSTTGAALVGCAILFSILAVVLAVVIDVGGVLIFDLPLVNLSVLGSLFGFLATVWLIPGVYLISKWLRGLARFLEVISPYLSLLLFLLIGFGLPAFIVYQFGDGHRLISSGSSEVALLGRTLQFAFIAIASTLPALLYFLFDRQKLGEVHQNFYHEIMGLDPDIQTLTEAKTKYDDLVKETYGLSQTTGFLLGAGSPILISTLLITLGWTLTLLPIGETTHIADGLALDVLFSPARHALNFGFLGAYFFAVNMVFRRYVRADLTPKTYTHITMRLLITIVIVWVLSLLPPVLSGTQNSGADNLIDWPLLVFAFFVGIVPETGLALLQDALHSKIFNNKFSRYFFPSLQQEEYRLTKLEGITLYDQARLLEEGIENIENLAHAQMIELMLRTRIPTPRLVDLFDQAILYLHIHRIKGGQAKLREYGIRTATDLEQVCKNLKKIDSGDFLTVLDDLTKPPAAGRLQILLEALKDDEWMAHLRHWRDLDQPASRAFTLGDFAGAMEARNDTIADHSVD